MRRPRHPDRLRFWVWVNSGWCRLSLRPGQALNWHRCAATEEGWEAEHASWSLHASGVLCEAGSEGRDCDGRLSYWWALHWDGETTLPADENGPERPDWQTVDTGRRDYQAEAAGY